MRSCATSNVAESNMDRSSYKCSPSCRSLLGIKLGRKSKGDGDVAKTMIYPRQVYSLTCQSQRFLRQRFYLLAHSPSRVGTLTHPRRVRPHALWRRSSVGKVALLFHEEDPK